MQEPLAPNSPRPALDWPPAGPQVTKQSRTIAEADQVGDLGEGPARIAHQSQRHGGALAIQVGRGSDPMDRLERPQKVKRRKVRGARDFPQADGFAIVRVDKAHAEADTTVQFAASRRLGGRNEPVGVAPPGFEPQHTANEELQLLFEPAILGLARVDHPLNMAQDGGYRAVVFLQPLVELRRAAA